MKLIKQVWGKRRSAPAIFLDRDGTLIEHRKFHSSLEQIQLLPGVVEGLQTLQAEDYLLVVVTNQPNVERGENSVEEMIAQNEHIHHVLNKKGIQLDAVYTCPHKYPSTCTCRKPAQGLIEAAQKDFDMDMNHSWYIGDTGRDMETGKRAGVQTIFLENGEGANDPHFTTKGEFEVGDLTEAAKVVTQVSSTNWTDLL